MAILDAVKHVAISRMYAVGRPDAGPKVKKINCLHGWPRPSLPRRSLQLFSYYSQRLKWHEPVLRPAFGISGVSRYVAVSGDEEPRWFFVGLGAEQHIDSHIVERSAIEARATNIPRVRSHGFDLYR